MTEIDDMELLLAPTADPAWVFVEKGFDALREGSVESRFAISNGFLGVRGVRATSRGARWAVPARTYVAGLFDTPDIQNTPPGLVPVADWLRVRLLVDGEPLVPLAWSWTWRTQPGQVVCFERSVAIVRSGDAGLVPGLEARSKLSHGKEIGWRGVLARHEAAWASRWQLSDVTVEGGTTAQRALRFALYHLNSAANPNDKHVSIGARALTGNDYHGHVFWDTEIFLLPFYTLTWPEAARTLPMYRFRTIDAARAKAAGSGWRGAFYAWESADTGAEMTPT